MSSIISCHELSKTFGNMPLFSGITFGVESGDRIGVIGPNGSGKSTFLKILAGQIEADEGKVSRQKLARIVYVAQSESFDERKSVREVAEQFAIANGVDREQAGIASSIALSKIGVDDTERKFGELSGGWRKRVAIASALACEPDLLLLDEPTNHLDIAGVIELEAVLKSTACPWVMISHDRVFLENTVNKVVEINKIYPGNILAGTGGYSEFLLHREEYRARLQSTIDSMANKVRREVEWLRRGPQARTTKSKSRIDAAHELQGQLKDLQTRASTSSTGLEFEGSGRKSKKLMELTDVSFGYDKPLISNLSLSIGKGEKVGLLGNNGAGKTTLIRILMNELAPEKGSIQFADDLTYAYFSQKRDEVDENLTLKRALCPDGDSVVYRGKSIHVVTWARKFLFVPEQLDLEISKLSGGELARMYLANFMLTSADVLVLDEPTNDLDIPTLEILQDSLEEFTGVVLLVSHDRYLLEKVCSRFVGLGTAKTNIYASVDQWLADSTAKEKPDTRTKTAQERTAKKTKKLGYLEQREFDGMESAIQKAEEQLGQLQEELEKINAEGKVSELVEASEKVAAKESEVERLYIRWEELEAKVQELTE